MSHHRRGQSGRRGEGSACKVDKKVGDGAPAAEAAGGEGNAPAEGVGAGGAPVGDQPAEAPPAEGLPAPGGEGAGAGEGEGGGEDPVVLRPLPR